MNKYLICGSRSWDDIAAIERVIKDLPNHSILIEGGAKGADTIAGNLAETYGHFRVTVSAPWNTMGRKAGTERNLAMLALKPDKVFAFQIRKSIGTQHTINHANKLGIPVEVFKRG